MDKVSAAIDAAIRHARLPPELDPDDVRQDVWVKLLESDFDPERPGAANYAHRATVNYLTDRLRSRRVELPIPDVPDERHDLHRRIESEEEQWDRIRVSESIASLPKTARRLLKLRFDEGLSYAAIGKRIGKSRERARQRVSAILSSLRQSLPSLEESYGRGT